MTVKTNKPGVVTLTCEGIRTTGVMCDGEIKVSIENKHPETGRPYTKTARVTVARKRAQVKGWSLVKRADACPRVHGMIPLPAPKPPAALVA
jgi:hypothetical protein